MLKKVSAYTELWLDYFKWKSKYRHGYLCRVLNRKATLFVKILLLESKRKISMTFSPQIYIKISQTNISAVFFRFRKRKISRMNYKDKTLIGIENLKIMLRKSLFLQKEMLSIVFVLNPTICHSFCDEVNTYQERKNVEDFVRIFAII